MAVELGKPTEHGYRLPYIRHLLCKPAIQQLKSHGQMLDYGCGNGANTKLFHSDFENIFGIDVENERVAYGIDELMKEAITNVTLSVYNGESAGFSNESMDMVTSFEVLEHVRSEQGTLREIHRVLKPGGIFCLSVPNKWYLMETHGFKLPFHKIVPYNRVPFLNLMPNWFYKKWGNARIYTKNRILHLLTNSGFIIDRVAYIKPPFDIVGSKLVKDALVHAYNFMPGFMGVSIFIQCHKPI